MTLRDDCTIEDGTVNCGGDEGSHFLMFIRPLDAKSEEAMKAGLPGVVEKMDLGEFRTSKISDIIETKTASGLKLFGVGCAGKYMDNDFFYWAKAFSPKKGTAFVIFCTEAEADARAHEKMIAEILSSITSLSGGTTP